MPKESCYKSVKFEAGGRGGSCRVETVEINLNGRHSSRAIWMLIQVGDLGLTLGGTQMKATTASRGQERCLGSMPNFLMREISVVRLIAIRAAAPSGPPTRPFVSRRTRMISSRSFSSNSLAALLVVPLLISLIVSLTIREISSCEPLLFGVEDSTLDLRNSVIGTSSDLPRVRITARSTKFSSSRMFPGHSQFVRVFIADAGIVSMCFCIRLANFWTKKRTSKGISSLRSRNGGMRMGNTFRR